LNRGFSPSEVLLIAGFTAVVTLQVSSLVQPRRPTPIWVVDGTSEHEFVKRFGSEHYSGGLEEYIIRDFFHDRRGGIFLDVGAFHAKEGSNTYRLERDFGWSGLAIDANADFAPEYSARPRSIFEIALVGSENTGHGTLYVAGSDSGESSTIKEFTEQWGPITRTLTVPKRTLDSLLQQHHIESINLLSMDIELAEPAALQGFDIELYRPELVGVEAHPPVRNAILEYFTRHGYVLVGDYLRADPLNYWFRPLATTTTH
jgi:FkbM family methyltransferase